MIADDPSSWTIPEDLLPECAARAPVVSAGAILPEGVVRLYWEAIGKPVDWSGAPADLTFCEWGSDSGETWTIDDFGE